MGCYPIPRSWHRYHSCDGVWNRGWVLRFDVKWELGYWVTRFYVKGELGLGISGFVSEFWAWRNWSSNFDRIGTMRGFSWRAKGSELYTLLLQILSWAVSLSLFNPDPVSSTRPTKRGEAVKHETVVSDEKRAFLENFGGVYGYPDSACPIDKLRASEFPRLNGMPSDSSQFNPCLGFT